MEPFRAFVADKLPEEQRTLGFVMQSFFIGIGQTLANALPIILTAVGVTGVLASGIPVYDRVRLQDWRRRLSAGGVVDGGDHQRVSA